MLRRWLCWLFCHPLLRFSASVGAVLCSLFSFPCLRVGALLACCVCSASWLRGLCSLGCPSWLVLLLMSPFVLHLLLWVRLFGLSLLAPPAAPVCWALVGSLMQHSVTLAYCRALSCCFSPGFLPLAFGLEGCGPVLVPPFLGGGGGGGGGSPSLVLVVFAWRFQLFCCPSSLSFLELFAGVLSSRFLGYPPSVAWLREVLPWFSVRGMSACPSGAAVPRASSVLRGSWSSRWGHLCSSSVSYRNEDFPSFWWVWFLGFVWGPLPQAGAVFFGLR